MQRILRGTRHTPHHETILYMGEDAFLVTNICAMNIYENRSPEELRYEDFLAEWKGGEIGAVGPFGAMTQRIGFTLTGSHNGAQSSATMISMIKEPAMPAQIEQNLLKKYVRESIVLFSSDATLALYFPYRNVDGVVQIIEHVSSGVAHMVFYRRAKEDFVVDRRAMVFEQIYRGLQLQFPTFLTRGEVWGVGWGVSIVETERFQYFQELLQLLQKNSHYDYEREEQAIVAEEVDPRRASSMQLVTWNARERLCTMRYETSSITDIPLQSSGTQPKIDGGEMCEMCAKIHATSRHYAEIEKLRVLHTIDPPGLEMEITCNSFRSNLRRSIACVNEALDKYQKRISVNRKEISIAVEKALRTYEDFEARQTAITQCDEVSEAMVVERDDLRQACVASIRQALKNKAEVRETQACFQALLNDILECRGWLDERTGQTSGEMVWWAVSPGTMRVKEENANQVPDKKGLVEGEGASLGCQQHTTTYVSKISVQQPADTASNQGEIISVQDVNQHNDRTGADVEADERSGHLPTSSSNTSVANKADDLLGASTTEDVDLATAKVRDSGLYEKASDQYDNYEPLGDISKTEDASLIPPTSQIPPDVRSDATVSAGEGAKAMKEALKPAQTATVEETTGDTANASHEQGEGCSTDFDTDRMSSQAGALSSKDVPNGTSDAIGISDGQANSAEDRQEISISTKCAAVLASAESWLSASEYQAMKSTTDSALEHVRSIAGALLFDNEEGPGREQNATALEKAYRSVVDERMYLENPQSILNLAPLLGIRNILVPLQYFVSAGAACAVPLVNQIVELETILAKCLQGLVRPDLDALRKIRREFKAMERERMKMTHAIDILVNDQDDDDSSSSDTQAVIDAKRRELQEWDVAQRTRRTLLIEGLCRQRTEVLRHAEAHYPELLHSRAFKQAQGLNEYERNCAQMGLLWANASLADYLLVKDFSSEIARKNGRTVRRVRGPKGQDAVIKSFALDDRSMRKQFFRQCEYLAQLSDINLVKVLGVFVEASYGRVVMPYYSGGSLKMWLDTHKPTARTVEECQRLAREILMGVASLHTRGFVHCDIKPGNVLLTQTNRCILSDFDGVQYIGEGKTSSAAGLTKSFVGTMEYLAPEMKGENAAPCDRLTDAYAAGKVVFKLFDEVEIQNPALGAQRDDFLLRMTHPDRDSRMSVTEAIDHPFLGLPSEKTNQCVVCNDIFRETDGICCDKGHFNHSQCIEGWLLAQADAENHAQMRKTGGELPCMGRYGQLACDELFSASAFIRIVSADAIKAYEGVVKSITESCMQENFALELERAMKDMEKQFAAQGEVERQVRYIADEILTIKCPRQGHAFIDFMGCFALECRACDCRFCAYCLQDCGRDAHPHVRRCPKKPAGSDLYYGTKETFNNVMRDRRRDLLRTHWQSLTLAEADRIKVAHKIQPLLDALEPPHGKLADIVKRV